MKIDINWLKDWVEVCDNISAQQLAKDLVKVGLEEEAIHSASVVGPVVLGVVKSLIKEPQSNGKIINYCRVDVAQFNDQESNEKNELEVGSRGIICGAHNFEIGDKVVVALPGAVLPGDFKIASRKTYGHISNGMICSKRELGLGDEHDGIIVLNSSEFSDKISSLLPGDDIKDALNLDKEVLEINITPDRGYCFSMRGIAREYSHSTDAKFTDLVEDIYSKYNSKWRLEAITDTNKSDVIIDDNAPINNVLGCSKFAYAVVKNIDHNAKTPDFMVERLENAGMRSVNLVVDITNYVMLNFGQPLHAYDYDLLNFPIVVRRANANEKIISIDEKVRDLFQEDLVISDSSSNENVGNRPIGIAGVMGGFDTEINSQTQNVFIESAYFDPISIARSSRRHKLPSEASKRFERGVDNKIQIPALFLAIELLIKYGKGQFDEVYYCIDKTKNEEKKHIIFDLNYPSKLLGYDISQERVIEILKNIGCDVKGEASDQIEIFPPSWRPDLNTKEDLVEEVARLNDYKNIPSIRPIPLKNNGKSLSKAAKSHQLNELISNMLVARGCNEVLSYPFVAEECVDLSQAIAIKNPLSEKYKYLRTNLLSSLLDIASVNSRRNNKNFRIFEIGSIFVTKPGINKDEIVPEFEPNKLPSQKDLGMIARKLPSQPKCLSAIVTSSIREKLWIDGNKDFSIASWVIAKSELLAVLASYGLSQNSKVTFIKADDLNDKQISKISSKLMSCFHPYMSNIVTVNSEVVGVCGQLHPDICKKYDLPENCGGLELNLDALNKFKSVTPYSIKSINTNPYVHEDYSFVMPSDNKSETLIELIGETLKSIEIVKDFKLNIFDVYQDDKLRTECKKVISLNALFASDVTLKDKDVKMIRELIITSVAKMGASLR